MYNKIGKVAAQRLTSSEIQRLVPGWTVTQDTIQKEFKLKDFENTWVRLTSPKT